MNLYLNDYDIHCFANIPQVAPLLCRMTTPVEVAYTVSVVTANTLRLFSTEMALAEVTRIP